MFQSETFVAGCLSALGDPTPSLAIKELVAEAVSQPSTTQAALGPASQAGLFPLYRSDRLTVLKVLWAPGMTLYAHDHRMWAVIGIYGGQEDDAFYKRQGKIALPAGGRELGTKDSVLLGADVADAVTNRQRVFAEAIHVYGGDFFGVPWSEWDPETLEERPFDLERAMAVFANANEALAAGTMRTA